MKATEKSTWMTPTTVINGATYTGGAPFNGSLQNGGIAYTITVSTGAPYNDETYFCITPLI